MVILTKLSYDEWIWRQKMAGNWRGIKIIPTLQDLHLAIRLKNLDQVKALVQSNLNIDSSLLSCTALSLSIYRGTDEIVQHLLLNKADPNKLSCDWNQRIEPPLFAACRLNKESSAKSLLKHGADPNCTDSYNHTPLWIAVRERNLTLVQLLIDNGANLNSADKWAQCPLYLATKYFGRENIAALLIRHGCSLDCSDREGYGTFYWALTNGQFQLVTLLIQGGVHISTKMRQVFLESTTNLPESLTQNEQYYNWLKKQVTNPPKLGQICSNQIRKELSRKSKCRTIWPFIEQLPIPLISKDKLKLLDKM